MRIAFYLPLAGLIDMSRSCVFMHMALKRTTKLDSLERSTVSPRKVALNDTCLKKRIAVQGCAEQHGRPGFQRIAWPSSCLNPVTIQFRMNGDGI
jgi:hypothetical protein